MDRWQPIITRLRVTETRDRFQADALGLVDSVVRRLPPSRAGERLHVAAERLRPPPRHRMMPILEQFAELRPNAFFVQVGSHDGQQQDPLRDIVLGNDWSGIMVEPVPYVFARLKTQYGHLPRIKLENVAVGPEDGPKTFYHLRDASDAGRAGLPIWFDALGSFRLDVLLAHRRYIPDIESRIVEIEVPCVTFDSLCRRNDVERVDFLHTDTEGYDFEILKSVAFDRFRPTLIVYESFHLAPEEKQGCASYLRGLDYDTIEYGLDTWCFNRSTLPMAEADVLAPLWRWLTDASREARPLLATRVLRQSARRLLERRPPASDFAELFKLTEAERRYLVNGYDDCIPLPNGAADYLTGDNPRLRELTERHHSLELAAVAPCVPEPEHVSAQRDFRYFRADRRHYPGHPRPTAMVLFIYMRYLECRGGGTLLDVLAEDGAFGVWTADVVGRGKLSRDRLDSVNEIMFLERQLGVLSRSGIRIVETGGGHGRFAHRIATAHPSLGDYCCVADSPQSAFVSEYYLKFRGVSQTTRVVPLDEVPAMEAGSFNLAVNVESFSACRLVAIDWWAKQLARLRVPHLFVVGDRMGGISSNEPDGRHHDAIPTLKSAGYQLRAVEPAITDPAVRELVCLQRDFHMFSLDSDPEVSAA